MEKKRSVGVTILGSIMLICGLFLLIGSLVNRELTILLPRALIFPLKAIYFVSCFFFHILLCRPVALLWGLAYLIAGINILRLKDWARIFSVYLSGLSGIMLIIEAIYQIIYMRRSVYLGAGMAGSFFLLFFSFLIIFFFTRPKVKEQFK